MTCFSPSRFFPSRLHLIPLMVILLISGSLSLSAGDRKYPISEISPELLKNADLVVRLDETTLEIKSLSKVTEKIHLVYTVLRASAKEKAFLTVDYDQDSKITNLEGRIYDETGRETDRIRSADILDQSAVQSGTLYSDDRVKHIGVVASHYPYTVEYKYERSSRQLMQYPQWRGVNGYYTSVGSAILLIRAENETFPRTLTTNFPQNEQWPVKNSDSSLRWELHNFQAMIPEPLSAGLEQIVPTVYIAPSQVLIPGQDPEPASWRSYGIWVNALNRDRESLPVEITSKIRELTSGTADTISKMKLVYYYFQENTRYIGVQIGIGGYQPADAHSVARNGYGDCKALTNYLKALLNCAGIPSHYTLVRAGKNASPIITGFPALQFNHAILCIPLKPDTVWLECTSQTIPFGFLGSFTDDRNVLIITPGGGMIAHTPSYSKLVNRLNRIAVVDLDSMGNARIKMTTKVTGLEYEIFESRLHKTFEEQKKIVREIIQIPTVNITHLSYDENDGMIPEIIETLEMNVPAYATLTGNRIFIPANPFNRAQPLPLLAETRILPFYTDIGFTNTDSIIFHYPSPFKPDNLPDPLNVSTPFGKCTVKTALLNSNLLYVRNFTHEGGSFPPEDYPAYHSFIKQISKADKNMIIMQ